MRVMIGWLACAAFSLVSWGMMGEEGSPAGKLQAQEPVPTNGPAGDANQQTPAPPTAAQEMAAVKDAAARDAQGGGAESGPEGAGQKLRLATISVKGSLAD